jgi:hypothetical protein
MAKDVKIFLSMPKEDWQSVYLILLDIDEYHHIAVHIVEELKKQVGWKL